MHSLTIVAISLCIAALAMAGFGLTDAVSAIVLAASVALIGVPHGSFDPLVGRLTLQRFCGKRWQSFFYAGYLSLGAVVVAGWYVAPLVTCLAFLALSAWHFGLEEDYSASTGTKMFDQLLNIARGGLIIWSIFLFRPEQAQALLAQVFPRAGLAEAATASNWVRMAAPMLLALATADFLLALKGNSTAGFGTLLRVASFMILAAVVSPLVSFGIYFCGWHSLRGLHELRGQVSGRFEAFILRLLPLTVATLVMGLLAFAFWSQFYGITPSLNRTVFIGLSAVAIPHLALHTAYRLTSESARPTSLQGVMLCHS